MANKLPLITDINDIPEQALVPLGEQPYVIPEHWKWVRLGSLITLISGRDAALTKCNDKGIGIPYVMGASNFVGSNLNIERWIEAPEVVSPSGALLLTVKGTIGKLHVQEAEKMNLSRQVMALVPGPCLTTEYLHFFMSAYITQLETAAVGLIPGISRADVLSTPIPLSSLDEQSCIVEYIEQINAKIDDVIQRLEHYVDEAPNRRAELIRAGVNGILTSDWRDEQGRSIDDWESMTLGEAFKWSSGGTPSRKRPEYYEGTIPWIKSGELPDGRIADSEEHISEDAVASSSAKIFPQDSVLIAMYGATIGKVGILDASATTNQAIACALPSPDTIPDFLALFLQARKPDFIALGKGGAQPNISQTVIKAFPFRRPPLEEQEKIVKVILSGLAKIDTSAELTQRAIDDIETLREATVLAALSGRLGLRP